MAKIRLGGDIDFGFDLYGLITEVKEYKLAWLINRHIGIRLVKQDDIRISFVNQEELIISNYLFETENSYFRLLKNRSIGSGEKQLTYMVPELQRFDYLIQTQGMEERIAADELKRELAGMPQVQFLQRFEPTSLRSRENLIF